MPVGELVMHTGPIYYNIHNTHSILGIVTEIFVEQGRNRYKIEWLNSQFPGDISIENSSTIQPLRKAYRVWKQKNVEPIQKEKEGTTTKSG